MLKKRRRQRERDKLTSEPGQGSSQDFEPRLEPGLRLGLS